MRTLAIGSLVLLAFLLLRIRIVSSTPTYEHMGGLQATDQCDWIGSGGGGRGVRPVYLRCSRGTVSWRYPRGAVRVVLSAPVPVGDSSSKIHSKFRVKEIPRFSGFRACTKVCGPVRVYLESNGKLRPVYSPRDGKNEGAHRCFYTKKDPTAFYIEAEEPWLSDRNNSEAKLQYDLEVQYAATRSDTRERLRRFSKEEEDCRPCSMEELAKAYCQSDLVARGTVSAVQKQPDFDAAELVVGITKILRRIENVESEKNEGSNEVDTFDSRRRKDIRVRVPTACDARHGQGEFVIMAKRRLGDLVLVCAPRLETWAKTVRELKSAPCVLRS